MNDSQENAIQAQVDNQNLYSNLIKKNDPALVEENKEKLKEKTEEEIEQARNDSVEWQSLKSRWDSLGTVYERLNQCILALSEETSIYGIQQLDNAKRYIGHAKAELDKAFKYECDALATETGIPSNLETPWATNVKAEVRPSKSEKDELVELEEDTRN